MPSARFIGGTVRAGGDGGKMPRADFFTLVHVTAAQSTARLVATLACSRGRRRLVARARLPELPPGPSLGRSNQCGVQGHHLTVPQARAPLHFKHVRDAERTGFTARGASAPGVGQRLELFVIELRKLGRSRKTAISFEVTLSRPRTIFVFWRIDATVLLKRRTRRPALRAVTTLDICM
jgi:hypothetical protein